MSYHWPAATAALCALSLIACSRRDGAPSSKAAAPEAARRQNVPRVKLPHLLLEREGNAAGPWIVALHGLGDTPEGFASLFSERSSYFRVYIPQGLRRRAGGGFDWLGASLRRDGPLTATRVEEAAAIVASWIQTLREDPKNLGKPIVTGFSQGGALSYALALLHPDKLVAALPLSGTLPQELLARAVARTDWVPVFALHGAADPVVPARGAQATTAALKALGIPAQLTVFPNVPHAISASMLAEWRHQLETAAGR